jgi:hypothetical protein
MIKNTAGCGREGPTPLSVTPSVNKIETRSEEATKDFREAA